MITHTALVHVMSLIIVGSSLCTNASNAHVQFQAKINYTPEEISKVGLVVGAIGLATYGIVKLGDWLFNKSDESLVEQAQQCISQSSARYASITAILDNAYPEHVNNQEQINNASEQVLYELAKEKHHDADIAIYLRRFSGTIKNIDKQAKNLQARVRALQCQLDQNYGTYKIIMNMKAIETKIQSTLPSLKFAYDYLKHHESFFILFETEDTMMFRYERDLHATDSYNGDINYIRDMIHQSVMLHQRHHRDPYPYHWYLKRLEADIYTMHTAMNKLDYEYTNRYNVANALCSKLGFIRETLIGSPYYADELRAYEYAKLAQAAIDAQQYHTYNT